MLSSPAPTRNSYPPEPVQTVYRNPPFDKYCHNCKKAIYKHQNFCPHCGTKQNIHCKCGKEFNTNFCPDCGDKRP